MQALKHAAIEARRALVVVWIDASDLEEETKVRFSMGGHEIIGQTLGGAIY